MLTTAHKNQKARTKHSETAGLPHQFCEIKTKTNEHRDDLWQRGRSGGKMD